MAAVSVLCFAIVTGCQSNSESPPTKSDIASNTSSDKDADFKAQIDALTADNQKLQEQVKQLESKAQITDDLSESIKQNPQLEPFTSIQNWDKMVISEGQNKVTVTDPALIEQAAPLFLIAKNNVDLPNGPPNDIDAFTVELTNSTGTYFFEVHSRNYGSLPHVTNEIFKVSSDLANLGRALLPRQSYLPEESLESRLLNSGALSSIGTKSSPIYYFSESRVRSVAKVFLTGEKKQISASQADTAQLLDDIAFLLNGQQIQMKVYSNAVQLIDNKKTSWYKVDAQLSAQLHSQLSGS